MVPNQHAASGIDPGGGSIWDDEGQILAEHARQHGGPVLEIGTQRGISARYILRGLDAGGWDASHLLYAVDLHHQHHLADTEPRMRAVSCNSAFYAGPPVKWAFVDGLHTYDGVLIDIEQAMRHGANVIFLHDYCERLQGQATNEGLIGVRRAVQDWLAGHPDWKLTTYPTEGELAKLERTQP